MRHIQALRKLLQEQEIPRGMIVWASTLTLLLAVLESIGLGMLLPLLTFVEQGPVALQDGAGGLARIIATGEALDIPITFATLTALTLTPLVLRQIVMYVRLLVVARITHRGTHKLRGKAIKAGLNADLRFFIDRKHGDFPNSMLTEPQNATAIAYVGIGIILHVLMCMAYFAMLFYVSPVLTALVVPVVLVLGLIVRHFSGKARNLTQDVKNKSAALYQGLSEAVRGIRLIRMRANEHGALDRLVQLSNGIVTSRIAYERAKAIVDSGGPLILTLGIFVIMYLAVADMGMRLAELGFFLFVLMRMQQVVTQLNQDRLSFARLLVSVEHVREFVEAAQARPMLRGGEESFSLRESLRFENVSFGYARAGENIPVLKALSFEVEAGRTIAIVGRSGAGKSTIVDLILRNYAPQEGRVTFDGKSLESIGVASLRRGIGVVTQDTFLFHESVRDNLCYGLEPGTADDVLWEALRKAHADAFVRALPNGLHTLLGEGGADLSGGQRQRLNLARALVPNPSLLILDEPTSALDSETEAAIQASLDALHGQVTIIAIAHRLTTIHKADRILVMNEGRIVGTGNHRGLLESDPVYRRMFYRQAL